MSVEDLHHTLELYEKFKAACVVSAGCELEVFDKLDACPSSAASLAARHGWNADATRRLFDALTALGYLKKEGKESEAVYSLCGPSSFLIRNKDPTIWGYTQAMRKMFNGLQNLAKEVRTGGHKADDIPEHITVHHPPKEQQEQKEQQGQKEQQEQKEQKDQKDQEQKGAAACPAADSAPRQPGQGSRQDPITLLERYRFYDGLGSAYAPRLVKAFDFSCHGTVVDLGGGSGVMSLALSRAYPSMQITVYEVPPVIQMLRDTFLPADVSNVQLREGDFMKEERLPAADLYLLGKVVHDWRPDQVDAIIAKVSASVNPGGGVVLLEKCLDDSGAGPWTATNWDMMVMAHCGGNLRSARQYSELLTKHGFSAARVHKTEPLCSYDVIYARKPDPGQAEQARREILQSGGY